MRRQRGHLHGFTFIEVMFATLLLGVVGTAIFGFLSAVASGSNVRQHASDAALEASLAARRISTLAPRFRAVLRVSDDEALIWLNDLVPSRSVHLSEVGCIRFDAAEGELVFESVDPNALADDRSLEGEFPRGNYDSLAATFEDLRAQGSLVRSVLAEGLELGEFMPLKGTTVAAQVEVATGTSTVSFTLAPADPEEPLR